ncbi:hypothetical protein D9757_012779 [Collybiopsis confluens]|uniref:DUF6535 domain-containing protein n=1 Tax=Collybiopsis confluens TaxID=2823264 RepID=A0A8H5FTC7_9AGAR|nr:hypothetical protein D9757_012779 [Collybiopsis confluens]
MSDGLSESSSNVMPLLAEMLTVMRSMHELMKIQGEHRKVSVDNFPKSIFRPPPPDNNKAHPSGTQETQTISPVIIEREMESDVLEESNTPNLAAPPMMKTTSVEPAVSKVAVATKEEPLMNPAASKPPYLFLFQECANVPKKANYDYRLKYPPDRRYCELDPEARVWWVYNDEAKAFDDDMVGELGDSLDILMVITGLFSAVVSTFVTQTYQAFSPDYTQLSASYLADVIILLRNANGTLPDIPSADMSMFSPSFNDLWVNGLWFTSLTISLSVALLAVLAKQWLRQYASIVTGTPRERTFIPQFRFDGLEKWRVQSIIGILPVLLHISLILFLIGLVIFLAPLSPALAFFVGGITTTDLVLYLAANILPLVITQCSYRTTFTDLLFYSYHTPCVLGYRLLNILVPLCIRLQRSRADFDQFDDLVISSLKDEERRVACRKDSPADQDFELSALTWLKRSTSSPSAKEIIVQSLGAFCPAMTSKIRKESSLFYDGYWGLYFWEKLQNPNHSDHWDNLEPLLRATVHMDDNILITDYEPHCNIQEALVLLAHGVQIVSHAHYADRDMTLTRTNVLSHFLALYTQGNFNEDVQVKMPTLVWFAPFNQAEKLDMRKSYPDYFGHGWFPAAETTEAVTLRYALELYDPSTPLWFKEGPRL